MYVCVCVLVYVCMCVCERERQADRERERRGNVYVYVCACVCVRAGVQMATVRRTYTERERQAHRKHDEAQAVLRQTIKEEREQHYTTLLDSIKARVALHAERIDAVRAWTRRC